jgi:hypothetical protein
MINVAEYGFEVAARSPQTESGKLTLSEYVAEAERALVKLLPSFVKPTAGTLWVKEKTSGYACCFTFGRDTLESFSCAVEVFVRPPGSPSPADKSRLSLDIIIDGMFLTESFSIPNEVTRSEAHDSIKEALSEVFSKLANDVRARTAAYTTELEAKVSKLGGTINMLNRTIEAMRGIA